MGGTASPTYTLGAAALPLAACEGRSEDSQFWTGIYIQNDPQTGVECAQDCSRVCKGLNFVWKFSKIFGIKHNFQALVYSSKFL